MQPHERTHTHLRRLALCASLMTATLAYAQTPPEAEKKAEEAKTPAATAEKQPATPAKAPEQKLPSKEEVTTAGKAATGDAALAEDGETLVLSPFEVTTQKDVGYRGGQTMSGTRMGADLDDIANPISVITKQQLLDFAAVDINDIFASELGVEGTRTFTANFNDGKQDVDSVALNPETANRVRGLGSANISVGNFGKSSTIPIDTYNIDAVEISRGPNSSIFGMGEASGTVNLVPSAANLSRDHNKFSLSYSSYGTKRATVDFNRMLWKNTFAIRVNALVHDGEFLRKPSYDKTRRLTLSGTYRPFSYTTLRASFERFNQKYSRPNSVTPREVMGLWNQVGRPSWNAFTNRWSYSAYSLTDPFNGNTTSFPGGAGTITPVGNSNFNQYINGTPGIPNGPFVDTPPPPGALWLAGYTSSRVRSVMFVDQGQVQWAGTQFYQDNGTGVGNTSANLNPAIRHELLQFSAFNNYGIPAEYQSANTGSLPYSGLKASKDKSFYDYESLSLSGLNYGKKKGDLWRVELEQFILNTPMNVFAFQLGLFKERIEDYRRTFVGNGGDGVPMFVAPDVNTHLPDGSVNPYYGAPFITALSPQTYVNPIDTRTHRANVVYQLDLTKEKNLLRHLGKTKLLGYAEEYHKTHVPGNLRYQDQISAVYAPWLTPSIRNANPAKFQARYYLGDASGNIDYGSSAPPINNFIAFRRYGTVATAPNPQLEPVGWHTLANVPVSPQYFAFGQQNMQTTTRGMILMNYLAKDRVITTWGRRRDTLRTRGTGVPEPSWARDPDTGLSTSLQWLDNYGEWDITNRQTLARRSMGYTDNKGIVVKPLDWLHLRYNQSTSFKPEEFGIDFQGNPLPNSSGESKDYGIRLNLFKGKIVFDITRYETFARNSRDNPIGVVARRITNLDFDQDINSTDIGFDLEDWYLRELVHSQGRRLAGEETAFPSFLTVTPEELNQAFLTTHARMGLTEERINLNRTYGNARNMTADRRSNGYEVSLDINPNPYLSIKFNGSQSETIFTNYGKTWQEYKNERMPIWTTITSPYTGQRWWDRLVPGAPPLPTPPTNTPLQNWVALNEAPMKVNLAQEGKPVTQYAKYKFNTLARYRLAGLFKNIPVVKDMTIGGKFSWIDKQSVGFYGAEPTTVMSGSVAETRVRDYDANRPIWTRAKFYVDAFATYDFRFYKNRIKGNVQLNAKNVGENGRLQAFGVNPDGSKYNYRIIDPTEYVLSVNFEL